MILKIIPLHYIQILCHSMLCKADNVYRTYIMLQWVVSLTAAKFKPLILSVTVFALSFAANMFNLMILYDFSLFYGT
jgi:hypothetical protein